MSRVRVILNPSAASGAAMRKMGELESGLARYELAHEIVMTRSPRHATELARAAIADGVEVIAVVGGDGTLNEVVQAYVTKDGEVTTGPDLALIPCGTGGDFKRTLGLSGATDEAIARIRHGARKPIDLGVLRFNAGSTEETVRGFVNMASFGLAGDVVARVNARPPWLHAVGAISGRAAFFAATLRAMAGYRNANVKIRVDGALWYEGQIVNVVIANGRYQGGGMMVAPHADPSDGRFEIVALTDMSKIDVLALTAKIYRGSHLAEEGIKVTSGTRIEAEPTFPWASIPMDVDGEQPGKLPLRATMHPAALTFRF